MRLFLSAIVLLSVIISCSSGENSNYEVGREFLNNNTVVRTIDTFTINTGSFKLNNLITSNPGRILLGHIKDDNLGGLTASSYFQVSTTNFSIASVARYDSIGFVMNYDTYYFGDTLQNQNYKLYRLTEDFEPNEEEGNFFNNSTLGNCSFGLAGSTTQVPSGADRQEPPSAKIFGAFSNIKSR